MPSWFTPLTFGASLPFFRICTFQTAEARVISVHWSWGFAVFGHQCSHLPGLSDCHTAPNGRLALIGLLPPLLELSLKTHWLLPPPLDPFGANGSQGGPLHRTLHCFAGRSPCCLCFYLSSSIVQPTASSSMYYVSCFALFCVIVGNLSWVSTMLMQHFCCPFFTLCFVCYDCSGSIFCKALGWKKSGSIFCEALGQKRSELSLPFVLTSFLRGCGRSHKCLLAGI